MLDGSSECSNRTNKSGICDFDLQEDDNELSDFLELGQQEYESKVEEWKKNHEEK